MISEFYFGTSWMWPIPYLPKIMLSANVVRHRKSSLTIEKPWMMDSGIGGMFKEDSRPRITLEEYKLILKKFQPPIAWTYDYPCEPTIRKKYGYSIREAQSQTIESTINLLDSFPQIQSVVQGWYIDDYLRHLDMIRDQGLFTERLGIGSICRRGQTSQIKNIISQVKRNVPGWVKLHGFGVKISILQSHAKDHLFSGDSMAWDIERRYYSWQTNNNNKGLIWQQKVPHLLNYIQKVDELMKTPKESLMPYLEGALK